MKPPFRYEDEAAKLNGPQYFLQQSPLAAALAAITTTARKELGVFAAIGSLIWSCGFLIEVVADIQKSRFRADPSNKEEFIDTGL